MLLILVSETLDVFPTVLVVSGEFGVRKDPGLIY